MYPWSGDASFRRVMKIIDPTREDKPSIDEYEYARDRLILWQVKSPTFQYLPEIEATLSLISAILKDRSILGDSKEVTGRLTHKYYDICTFYGMSIVKFCNLLPYYEMTKKKKIRRVIKKSKKTVRDLGIALNLPTWVLECRHATCHDSTNSLILLRQANTFCLTWIHSNYWSKLVEEEEETPEEDELSRFERQVEKWITLSTGTKRNILKEKISTLTSEKPEQTYPIIVDILLRESSCKLPKTDMDLGELPIGIVKSYAKIIRLIPNIAALQFFLHYLTKHFVDIDPGKARTSILWFKVITRCLAKKADKDLIQTLSLPELDPEFALIVWQRILHKAIRRLTKQTPEVVDHLANLIPKELVPPRAMNILKQLAFQATSVNNDLNIDPLKRNRDGKAEFFTIKDLLNQLQSLQTADKERFMETVS